MKNCIDCVHWDGNESIQDIYPRMDFNIPIKWKNCNSQQFRSSVNMYLKDPEYAQYTVDKAVEYYGLDADGKFRKNIEFKYQTSELFGCVFHEDGD